MKKTTKNILKYSFAVAVAGSLVLLGGKDYFLEASSHREAPMIANDPLADNTDLYAFRSPDDTNTVTIIANYVPFELPQGGPNYFSFGQNIRYEIHIKNDTASSKASKDDITYRFTFTKTNEDPTTFFDIRLGKENNKTTYITEKSTDGGTTWTTIVTGGVVPPPNIGPRSIQGGAGLGSSYNTLMTNAITTATGGGNETIFCGPTDDPFFVDLGGIFDLGETRAGGTGINAPIDGVAKYNVHAIAIKVPIATLQKAGKTTAQAANILDSDFIIGVWASSSRQQISTFNGDGTITESGNYIQVSRLGMPLTNEAIIPVGQKDLWNSYTPYTENQGMDSLFCNPELALYMDPTEFGGAVPAFANLKIQSASLGSYNFRNGQQGLSGLAGNPALDGTALAANAFGSYLLRPNQPRSVDLLPIFHTGVPNIPPYQLATGKNGNPLAAGKPFINNFFPNLGDMLRLNMAVPVTPRNSPDFSSLGLVQAAVLGLTDSRFNTTTNLQFIPNMDGFPNGRRLEDDVTRIELQAVGGVVLAAIGLWYDDYTPGVTASPVTPDLVGVLSYTTGVGQNDTTLQASFPYAQTPWSGYSYAGGELVSSNTGVITGITPASGLGIGAPVAMLGIAYPNPVVESTTIKYIVGAPSTIAINIYDITGGLVKNLVAPTYTAAGTYEAKWDATSAHTGIYLASIYSNGALLQVIKLEVVNK